MNQPQYQPPQALDLSAIRARGLAPLYDCTSGLIAQPPGGNCNAGAQASAACSTGMFYAGDAPCTNGTSPATGECVSGTSATNQTCASGGSPS